ncbi:MAG: hypothetical protein DDT39_00060 [Firmicutes bacterium]|nr:hypothetical protein [candidate division NPL-UPA2 bacterium]
MTSDVIRPTEIGAIECRSCGNARALDEYRLYRVDPAMYMDFCRACEQQHGTVALYRRFNAYGTKAIIDAVFSAARTPAARRTASQTMLLIEPKAVEAPKSNEELIRREMARREMARRRLIYFTTSMMPEYKAGWVHQDICRRLERFVQQVEAGKSPRLMLFMPPRHGKQLAHSTPVLTPLGWKTHGDLRVGDEVFHPSGKPVKVVAVSEETTATYDVTTTAGETFKAHANHEWTLFDSASGEWRVFETHQLAAQCLRADTGKGRYALQLPVVRPLEFPAATLPIAPRLFGAWLVDKKSEVLAETPLEVFSRFDGTRIPDVYKQSGISQRLELLAGMADAGGDVCKKTGRVCVATLHPQLCDDIVDVARSFGWAAKRHAAFFAQNNVYYAKFLPSARLPTAAPEKFVACAAKARGAAISSVKPATVFEAGRCVQVDAADGLYLVGRTLTPTHNSQLASDMFPSWVLGQHPEWSIIAASYAQGLPIGFSRNIRDRLRDPEYQALFPKSKLRADSQGVEEWKLTSGGGYTAAGVGTGVTGKGMHIGILDDPIKDAEAAASETIRDAAYSWYNAVFRTRLAPGGGILIIQTRWHYDDVSGRLLDAEEALIKAGVPEEEREGWEVVSYPAIAEADEYLMRDGTVEANADASNALRLLRKRGEALHAERYPTNELIKIRNGFPSSVWNALYQQRPTPDEGDFFVRDDFRYRWLDPAYRPLCRTFMTVDYAISKKTRNDFTVMGVFAIDSNDDLYCLELRRGRWKTPEIVDNVVALVERHKPEIYAGERGAIHEAVWPVIEPALMRKRLYVSVDDSLVPIQDKETRARPMQGRIQRHKFFFSFDSTTRPEIYDQAEREMLQFPSGAHDDIVDCLAWAGRLALNISLPTTKSPPKREGWRERLLRAHRADPSFMSA